MGGEKTIVEFAGGKDGGEGVGQDELEGDDGEEDDRRTEEVEGKGERKVVCSRIAGFGGGWGEGGVCG